MSLFIPAIAILVFSCGLILQRIRTTREEWFECAFKAILEQFKNVYCTSCGRKTTLKVIEPREKSYDSISGFIRGYCIQKTCECGNVETFDTIDNRKIDVAYFYKTAQQSLDFSITFSMALGIILLLIAISKLFFV